jgi:hypothetical protein
MIWCDEQYLHPDNFGGTDGGTKKQNGGTEKKEGPCARCPGSCAAQESQAGMNQGTQPVLRKK